MINTQSKSIRETLKMKRKQARKIRDELFHLTPRSQKWDELNNELKNLRITINELSVAERIILKGD